MLKKTTLLLIRIYQGAVSPWLPPACRFEPTCSEYARIAVETYGAARGAWLAVRRISRCHPFGGSGWDPVPESEPTTAHRVEA